MFAVPFVVIGAALVLFLAYRLGTLSVDTVEVPTGFPFSVTSRDVRSGGSSSRFFDTYGEALAWAAEVTDFYYEESDRWTLIEVANVRDEVLMTVEVNDPATVRHNAELDAMAAAYYAERVAVTEPTEEQLAEHYAHLANLWND